MKKLFWDFVSLFGTFGAGLGFVALAFLFGPRFGLLAFANLALITAASNTYKVFHFKARPDNPQGYRPPNPIRYATVYKLLDPRVALAYFKFVDAGSFPSIHSARSFNQALLFAFAVREPWGYPLFLALALLIGYSRVGETAPFPGRRARRSDFGPHLRGAFVLCVSGVGAAGLWRGP